MGETELSVRATVVGLIGCLMAGAFLTGSVVNCIVLLRKVRNWRRWLVVPSSFLVAVGALAFFGQMTSGAGGLNWLPSSFEWPAGRADDGLTEADGTQIVLLGAAGRIQIYDPHWHFVRGWPVRSILRIRLLGDGSVEALSKNERGYVFGTNGELLSQRTYEVHEAVRSLNSLPPPTRVIVPTPFWLYIFSSPLLSWLLIMAGMAGWFVVSPKSR